MKARELLEHARQNGYAIGAFNAANLETLKAIVNAGQKLNSPLIIEASAGEIDWVGIRQMVALVRSYQQETHIPIILNLDHSNNKQTLIQAIDMGFDYLHIDVSKEMNFAENLAFTKQIVNYALQKGIVCEGEIDHIQGSSNDHRDESAKKLLNKKLYTDPRQAQKYVKQTGVDTFAPFFGNLHGVYEQAPKLDFELLRKLADQLDCYLALHGGSGIRDQDIQRAIKIGSIVKINVNSELRIAFKETLKTTLQKEKSIKPYQYYQPVVKAVQKIVEHKIRVFGSTNQA